MIVIESIGRNINDAIEKGLAELGKSLDEVKVEIIKHGGLLSKAKVRITVEEDEATEINQRGKTEVREEKLNENREKKPIEQKEVKQEQKREHKGTKQEQKSVKEETKSVKSNEIIENNEEREQKELRRHEPVTPEIANKGETFLKNLLDKMNLNVSYEANIVDGDLYIDLKTENSNVIGYHGEVLDSIEYMVNFILNKDTDKYYHVTVNCNNYREKRKESLINHANKMAAKCLKLRHKIILEPMSSNDRKIIHSALADNEEIITRSEGREPNRHVVILCKRR